MVIIFTKSFRPSQWQKVIILFWCRKSNGWPTDLLVHLQSQSVPVSSTFVSCLRRCLDVYILTLAWPVTMQSNRLTFCHWQGRKFFVKMITILLTTGYNSANSVSIIRLASFGLLPRKLNTNPVDSVFSYVAIGKDAVQLLHKIRHLICHLLKVS